MQNYYGNNIGIVENAPISNNVESYPGVPLRLGDAGNNVDIIQTQLNRISNNYPAIPKINDPEGVFGVETQNAVRTFQQVFNLNQTGEVDKSTWYRIKQYYNGVKGLAELSGEGVTISEAAVPFTNELSEGMSGIPVTTLQYYLSILAYFNGALQPVSRSGYFGPETVQAVERFQQFYGLTPNGIVDNNTWNAITKIYTDTVASLPEGYSGINAKLYPGYFLTKGQRGENVRDLQTYLNYIGEIIPELPTLPVTSYFGDQTEAAVKTFQQLYGLDISGAVGPVTWATIAKEYDYLINSQNG